MAALTRIDELLRVSHGHLEPDDRDIAEQVRDYVMGIEDLAVRRNLIVRLWEDTGAELADLQAPARDAT